MLENESQTRVMTVSGRYESELRIVNAERFEFTSAASAHVAQLGL